MDEKILMGDTSALQHYLVTIGDMAVRYAPRLILALAAFFVGMWIIGMLTRTFSRLLSKQNVEASLQSFLESLINWTMKLVLGIAVIEIIGIKTTSFVAMLGAAGLAVGLALQGSLANFAGGVLILLFRPFKVGDYIIAQGDEGTVQKIDIFNTWLNKLDNRRVILPNGPLAGGAIINVTAEPIRRVDVAVGISYESNIDQARKVLMDVAAKDDRILKDPVPFVGMTEMADSSVNFTFRTWCKCEDYWNVYFDTNEAVKKALDANNITIPFPQRDVHMYNH